MKIPTYEAILNDEQDGISVISWVTDPATQIDMLCFNSEKQKELRFADEEQHMVTSVVMLADTKIYRVYNGNPYYILYTKDTLKQMCEKMLNDGTFNTCSFEHNGEILEPGLINLVELYTTDENKKSPFNVPEGSIIATYKVHDDNIWELFKSGEVSGISLEGYFGLQEHFSNINPELKSQTNKLKETFMTLLESLKNLIVEFDETKEVEEKADETYSNEVEVKLEDEKPEEKPEEKEEPEVEDETKIDEEEEKEEVETPAESDELTEVKTQIEAITNQLAELAGRLTAVETALQETTVTPVEEETFSTIEEDKFTRVANLLKK